MSNKNRKCKLRALRPEYTEASFILCARKRLVLALEEDSKAFPKKLARKPSLLEKVHSHRAFPKDSFPQTTRAP